MVVPPAPAGSPAPARAAELRAILGAAPSGDTRVDPEARPERQRVRAAVAALADGGGPGPARAGMPARWDLLERTPWPAAAPPAGVSLHELAATVCAPVRFEADNPYSEHRAYPSPRSKFAVRLVAQDSGAARLLLPEAGGSLEVPAPAGRAGDCVETFSLLSALPSFYGPLRPVLAGLETGHVLASAALLGRALGRPLTVAGPAEEVPAWAATLPDPALPGYLMADDQDTRPTGPRTSAPAPTWNDVVWNRNSGRVPRGVSGFTGAHRPAPAALWRDALDTLATCSRGLGHLLTARSALGLYCWVRGVEGVADGCHRVRFDGSALRVGGLEPARGALLIDSGAAPGLAFELDACNLVWMFTVDLEQACGTSRAPAPRLAADLLAATGWTAQHLSYAMAAHGLFARPLRSYDGEGAAEALELGPAQVPVYQLACGPNRFTEPGLDMRRYPSPPPTPSPSGAQGGAS
ncbi:hypothetical protein [Streptomyces sp. SPB4]|uniref:hypothetical protein n=1 Tax=Streptomyces sp. SPB4 TaxID=2940553 RepID=UPI002474402B|nr:hypothetical protein [Streptomyces sp. SPB4]